jgi:uncharacterized protein (DUF697 family)
MRKQITDFAYKTIKKSIMDSNPTGGSDKQKHADTVIRNHVLWSMGASFIIPIPVADIFAVSALQLDMIRQLCRVYDVSFAETQGKAIVTSLTSSTLARAGARSLIKLVPGFGTLIGGVTVSIFNGASTYALGQVFKRHFESGGTILDFDTERLKKVYKEQFEKGKQMAEQWRTEEPVPTAPPSPSAAPSAAAEPNAAPAETDVLARLRELGQLREAGVISEEEFEQMKKKLIASFQ